MPAVRNVIDHRLRDLVTNLRISDEVQEKEQKTMQLKDYTKVLDSFNAVFKKHGIPEEADLAKKSFHYTTRKVTKQIKQKIQTVERIRNLLPSLEMLFYVALWTIISDKVFNLGLYPAYKWGAYLLSLGNEAVVDLSETVASPKIVCSVEYSVHTGMPSEETIDSAMHTECFLPANPLNLAYVVVIHVAALVFLVQELNEYIANY